MATREMMNVILLTKLISRHELMIDAIMERKMVRTQACGGK